VAGGRPEAKHFCDPLAVTKDDIFAATMAQREAIDAAFNKLDAKLDRYNRCDGRIARPEERRDFVDIAN